MKRLYGGMKGGGTNGNWNGSCGDYKNPEVDALLDEIPMKTDSAKIKADYTLLTSSACQPPPWVTSTRSCCIRPLPPTVR
jgi:ABC-type transport system substrate-binding protein